jgi:hypothetical protein
MTTLNDVAAAHLNASGQAFTGPGRIGGWQVKPGGTAGSVLFYDNTSATGTPLIEVDLTTNTAVISTLVPGTGIRFSTGCYVTLPASSAITIFWG